MLLIYPPVAKPCEPPPGLARLAGALQEHGIECRVLDANLDGMLGLMQKEGLPRDRWTARGIRNLHGNLALVRSREGYRHFDRYKRAVMDLNRLLETAAHPTARVNLANYQQEELSPVKSQDLLRAAEHPEENIFYPYFSGMLLEAMEKDPPAIVGFSLNYLSQAVCTFAMLGFLRQRCPGVKLVLGGGLVTSWVRKPGWKNPFGGLADLLVAGPGEKALLSLAGCDGGDVTNVCPEYGGLPLDSYLSPPVTVPYSASSGCYWNKCSFCPERAERNPYIQIPPEKAIEDIRALVHANRAVMVHLLDNAVSPALMEALTVRPPGAPWYGFSRITNTLADPGFCLALRRSGCVMLKLGVESGDQDVIDREQKGIDLEIAARALKSLRKAGISTYVYLLFGTPSETLTKARRTLEFAVRHSDAIDFLNLAIFNMPVYGPETDRLRTRPLSDGDLSLYTGFEHPDGWNRGLVRQFLDKEFKRHPAVARILRRDPPFFTSNHAPFFSASQSTF